MSGEYRIRLAEAGDVEAIRAISNQSAMDSAANFCVEPEPAEMWREKFATTQKMFPWLVAVRAAGANRSSDGATSEPPGGVLGFAFASPFRGRCAYHWTVESTIYIHHEWKGKGIGSALYGRLFAILKAQGYRTVIAGITSPNPASEALHQRFGFRRVGVLERVGWKFDRWHDVGFWEMFFDGAETAAGVVRSVAEAAASGVMSASQGR